MPGKLFGGISIDRKDLLDNALAKALENVVLTFSLLSSPGVTVALYVLHVREQGGPWQNVMPNVTSDNDGEISMLLGTFTAGSKVEIYFGVLAVSGKVDRAATFVVRDASTPFKLAPSGPNAYKTIEASDKWEDTVSYEIPAAVVA